MTITAGSRLGPYEILLPLGAGGMGEVYRARDTRLERMVAIKVLPSHLASSPETRQRFEREAKTISQLSHPHICAVHDVGREGDVEYLVMELLEGKTLAERLARGPLPVGETLRFGAEISSALDAAHRKGIVHRDLKPSNIMLTKSGVKLLDFGLAKALEPAPTMESLTSAPTSAQEVTRPGMILGTVPYMAPEQLQGGEAGARGDIFSLGAVLYEMATGRKAFAGQSPISIMSAILTSEPPSVSTIAPASPPSLDRLIRTCLAKDPDDRWQTARDVELQLQAIQESYSMSVSGVAPARRALFAWLPWALTAALAVVVATLLVRTRGPQTPAPRAIRFSVAPPPGSTFVTSADAPLLALSPDGSEIAYAASDSSGRRIWLRPLSALEAHALPGTEGVSSLYWSPDGRSIAFFAEGKLRRLDLNGGDALALCDVNSGIGLTGSWGGAGEILSSSVQGSVISRVSASGGTPGEVVRADAARGEWRVNWPVFLPDGRRFLYFSKRLDGEGRLILAEPGKGPRAVLSLNSAAQYADPGYLLFVRDGVLLAQHFDPGPGLLRGEPFSVARHVRYFLSTGWGAFAVASSGRALAYQANDNVRRLVWFDRTGRELGTADPAGDFLSVAIAPDGRRFLFDNARPGIGTYDVWSFDVERGVESRITSELDTEVYPVWLRDGGSVVYSAVRGALPRLFRRDLATGREEAMLPAGPFEVATDVSPDGQTLLYQQRTEAGQFAVWKLPLSGSGKPSPVQQTPFVNTEARFSPTAATSPFSPTSRAVRRPTSHRSRGRVSVCASPPAAPRD